MLVLIISFPSNIVRVQRDYTYCTATDDLINTYARSLGKELSDTKSTQRKQQGRTYPRQENMQPMWLHGICPYATSWLPLASSVSYPITFASFGWLALDKRTGQYTMHCYIGKHKLFNKCQYNERINGYYDQYPIYSSYAYINRLIFKLREEREVPMIPHLYCKYN